MYNSVIAGYSRSPFAMANKGKLIDVKPVNLLAEVVKNLLSFHNQKLIPKSLKMLLLDVLFKLVNSVLILED